MSLADSSRNGWRGIALIAITYIYFLIFAQFAFLKRLAELNIADAHLTAVMAAMAMGGILFSLLTPRTSMLRDPVRRLQIALALCAAAAVLILPKLNLPASIAVAFLIGTGLGTLTVTLVTHLRGWLGTRNLLLKVGLGTGLGYLVCNFPPLFIASPSRQALTAANLCVAAIFIASKSNPAEQGSIPFRRVPFAQVLLSFTALIWLDSAAFFIIQSTPLLKAGTWQGTTHLYLNGVLHLLAALTAALILRRRGLSTNLTAAFLALACACLLLLNPHRALLASLFYPVGVSLYSVALVAYPALLSGSVTTDERGRQAGWIYAIGGWFGSAMGIGMGQHVGHIPWLLVAVAGFVILTPQLLRDRRRELVATASALLGALCLWSTVRALTPHTLALTQIERGRHVYVSEGCINCHSQYVRPRSPDVLLWGPTLSLEELRNQRPPLIGNRRQGPDLSEIGSRRSPLWLKAHFYAPAEVSHASFMPPYAYLFRGQQGDDLIAYLQTLQGKSVPQHRLLEVTWQPPSTSFATADSNRGSGLFAIYCGTCHSAGGQTRTAWKSSFHRLPPDLAIGPLLHLPSTETGSQRRQRLCQIIRFGIPGTDMPGHEYLSDRDIASLSLWLQEIMLQPVATSTAPPQNGEQQ